MFFTWLKRYLPRSLYGRAALILLVPIVVLQLVVAVAFLQRHFEDVTRQMTSSVALEINFLLKELNAEGAEAVVDAAPLNIVIRETDDTSIQDARAFYDISGLTVIRTLRDQVPGVYRVDLAGDAKHVSLTLNSAIGPVEMRVDRRRVSASNPHQLLVLTLLTGALMALIAIVFLRNQLRPIRRLARAAAAFGKGQKLDYHPSGALEVRAAGNAFLDMRARIDRQIEQRTLMLSGVSHDLRTPLTRLKLGLTMLDDAEAQALNRDVDDMERLLDAFLDFARGDALENMEEADPATLAREVVEDAVREGYLVRMGTVEVAQDGRPVMLRPVAIKRALSNLVSNARRFGSECEVSVAVMGTAVRFTVEDNGPGIPVHIRDEATKPFARLDRARNQDKGPGVGLGLAIVKDIARNHGGSLRLGDSARMGGLKADLVLAR